MTEQKIALEKLQRQSRGHYVRDRIRCILLASEGWLTKLIAQLQRIHETTVRRHLDDWFNEEKRAPKNGCSDTYLDVAQTAELIAYMTNNLFPTTQAITELGKVRFNRDLTLLNKLKFYVNLNSDN